MNETACPCGKPAETAFPHLGPLCRACFRDVLYKRCRKAAKEFGWLEPGKKVHLLDDKSIQCKAVAVLFRQVFKGLPLEHVPAEQADVIVAGKTADDEAEDFLQQLFAGKIDEKRKALNLLANISTAEIEKYCELEHIDGEKPQKSELRTRLDALEQRYPGTFFALQKSQSSFRK